jgi:hypothetical protein
MSPKYIQIDQYTPVLFIIYDWSILANVLLWLTSQFKIAIV